MEFAAILIIVKYVQFYILPEKERYRIACTVILGALTLWVAGVSFGNARFLSHHRAVLDQIVASYQASDDGVVYQDFSAKEVTFKDTYPSDVFTWYALNTLGRSLGPEKRLEVVPTLCKELKQATAENRWERTAKGTLAIVVDKENMPSAIKVQRSLFKKHLSDMWVSTDDPVFENNDNLVVLVYEKIPFVKHDSVVLP